MSDATGSAERRPEREAHAGSGVLASGVRRSFGDVEAVRGIDLSAFPGEVTGLVGPNGAGKTTLLLVPPAVWPTGLAVNTLLGVGAVALTTRRLRTPTRHLPRGQRVA